MGLGVREKPKYRTLSNVFVVIHILDYSLIFVKISLIPLIKKGSDFLIYENVKELCDKKGISISELEKKAKLGNGTIGGWRSSSPRLSNLQAVAEVLNVKIEKLLKSRG